MNIAAEQVWIEQATGDEVIVDWVSSELVSYLKPNAEKMVRTERKFVFMQLFNKHEIEVLAERENDGMETVKVSIGDL